METNTARITGNIFMPSERPIISTPLRLIDAKSSSPLKIPRYIIRGINDAKTRQELKQI
jgi:hypothetical protein